MDKSPSSTKHARPRLSNAIHEKQHALVSPLIADHERRGTTPWVNTAYPQL